ncbi:MAG: hypothetical protein A3A43_01670 [Candidatus Liptonbacteria bacterium RIFCSPLOWO2_01_FULL_56_20]|uniref:DUF1003 domain-containing protein n=1 Tax=Candidatus Liptonbacteria bacterium RIFCSPLOWO2_01_FULL_56_20 TaxID=1798652 RepID=A0A1G2CJL7_9BACT|nr:MAG: hypothetical protein A2681_00910 [Candidatus Liptonbacteria bacterium RIFCSPHIGHO2_01_FULL_56_18b]OGZ01596.1 MAG: hypothetical protein A3A43_01670 [Candidatus Liptonbacteria bacterium RIFCSPLOWO2_01_FULL_56_20]
MSPIPTLEELRSLRRPLQNTHLEHRERLTKLERLALLITKYVGSMGFFAVILVWTACWLIWNTSAPAELRFDPFPAFVLWLFISNFIQLFLLPLLLLGQNLEDRHAEIRARADLEVNRRAEQEIEAILARLEKQNELLAKLAGGGKDRK